jgi:predicted nucleic-acid-binding protein
VIAVDTNVLLRYLLSDDPEQSPRAAALFDGQNKILVTDVVLVETIWTLKGKKYKQGRESLARVISALFEEPSIYFEDGQTVWRALTDFRKAPSVRIGGKPKFADFSDALILNKAVKWASDTGESMDGLLTFDQALLELPGTRQP